MKKVWISIVTLFVFISACKQPSDKDVLEELLHNTVKVYQLMRTDNGFYRDYISTEESTDRGSTASIGMGLVAQCVAAEMGWNDHAEEEIIQTLQSVLGENDQGIELARTAENCFIHFYDIATGEAIGRDWSPIDTDIMISGALFAKRYFNENKTIGQYADQLYEMVNHDLFIGDWKKGQIALVMNEDGAARGSYTLPYNEYMIVAWLAKNQAKQADAPANLLWEAYYGNPEILPTAKYTTKSGEVFNVLTDHKTNNEFTSNFTFMFNYLFVNEFSVSPIYQEAMRQAALADYAWWNDRDDMKALGKKAYEWGTTAGVGLRKDGDEWVEGYTVDRICGREDIDTDRDRNQGLNVAVSALAGYSPVLPDRVRKDLLAVYNDSRGIGKMALPTKDGISAGNDTILWKYSYRDIDWRPTKVEGVDYGSMLLGLAALPELLGVEFFQEYNDFFNPRMPQYKR